MPDKQKILRTAEKFVLDQKFAAAVAEYRKLLQIEPDEPTLLNIVGDLLVRQGKAQEALKNFQRVVEIYLTRGFAPKAIAMLKKILYIAPQDLRSRESLADLYQKQGLQFDAIREYQGLVNHYVESGESDRALHFIKRLGAISPDDAGIPLRRAELLASQGKTDAALSARVEALQCFRRAGDFTGFRATFAAVMQVDPGHAEAMNLLTQIGEASHTEVQVREILADHLEAGAPEYPTKLYLARAEERVSNSLEAARLYKELRLSGHKDHEITEGLLRTDPESAFASSDAVFDEDFAPSRTERMSAPVWEPADAEEAGSGSGLFGSFEADDDDFQPDLEKADVFTFESEEPDLEDDPEQETAELATELEQIQQAPAEEPPPIGSLDEAIQEVDFYLKLGFKEDGSNLLERLLREFPESEEVRARARKVGMELPGAVAKKPVVEPGEEEEEIQAGAAAEGEAIESAFPDPDLFQDFETQMEDALDDLFVEGDQVGPEGSVLRYDVASGNSDQPSSPTVHYDLGLAYKEMGLVEDALQEFLIAMEMLDGAESEPQRILCCSMLTNTCRQLGRTGDAIRWAREGLEITDLRDFERRAFEYELSLALGENGNLEEAIELLEGIRKRDATYRDVGEKLSQFKSRLHG